MSWAVFFRAIYVHACVIGLCVGRFLGAGDGVGRVGGRLGLAGWLVVGAGFSGRAVVRLLLVAGCFVGWFVPAGFLGGVVRWCAGLFLRPGRWACCPARKVSAPADAVWA